VPEGSLRGPIGPQDIYLLFLEEAKLKGKKSVLADFAAWRIADLSQLPYTIARSKRKTRKYKRLCLIELIVILALLTTLWYA
jgi:hypothetical protein